MKKVKLYAKPRGSMKIFMQLLIIIAIILVIIVILVTTDDGKNSSGTDEKKIEICTQDVRSFM